ncbi:MAG: DUF167 domain-containing protein [Alphaproteobacteria bacterium]|nr:DUF167 domain-containing protein [Alphaproteobacteria bacterium]
MPEATACPFTKETRGLKVALRLTPGAKKACISGLAADGKGHPVVTARVTEPPEGGKANGALLKLLAKQWRIPKTSLSIVSGASSRRKTVLIEGDGEVLLQRLQEWIRSKNV